MFSAVVDSKMGIPNNGFDYSEDCIKSIEPKDIDIGKTSTSASSEVKLPQVFASLAGRSI